MAEDGRRDWIHTVGFVLVMGIFLFVILDMYPRSGIIRLDADDRVLVELLDTMR